MYKLSMGLIVVLALGVAGMSILLLPGDAGATPGNGDICVCGPTVTKAVTGVSTVDCAWALMDASHKANACGTNGNCEYTVVYDEGGCTPDGPSLFEYDLTIRQSCEFCR